jgi:formylglycine-generating enzyme required for sulfatase activity
VSLRIINHGPLGPWSDWLAHQNRASSDEPPLTPWLMPAPGTQVLIVSDLGLLLGPSSATAGAWTDFAEHLRRNNVKPLALVPLGPGQLGAPVPHWLPVLRWSPDARPHPVVARGPAGAPKGIDVLLAMMAVTRRVDPPLLRAMRRLNPRDPHNAGLEGAAWCHPHVDAGHTASIRPAEREIHLQRFAELPPETQATVDAVRQEHHRHLRALINHEEALLWESRAHPAAADLSPGAAERAKSARRFMRKVGTTATRGDADASWRWASVARGALARADAAMEERCADALYPLLAALQLRNDPWPAPEWTDPALLAAALGEDRPPRTLWLVRDALSGSLVLQPQPPGVRQSPLLDQLPVDDGGVRIQVTGLGLSSNAPNEAGLPQALSRYVAEEGGVHVQLERASTAGGRLVSLGALPAAVASNREPCTILLETALESVEIAPVERPLGGLSWGCDRDGLFVQSPPLGRWDMRWSRDALRPVPLPGARGRPRWALEAKGLRHPDARGALRFGIDAPFGVYAQVLIRTLHDDASQRLRWIPPGTFLMGSPEDEPGRFDNEGPRHQVLLTQGFWLFDTPCTQKFWESVMISNPSEFKSPDRPVDRVSLEGAHALLRKINQLVPGLDLRLPTEAQWERACCAGTDTATYAGDLGILGARNAPALDPIAWYGGNSGYDFDLVSGKNSSNWAEKQYPHRCAGTRRVALKKPNAWGLYDMLGNVWEWCGDSMRSYAGEAVTDPLGADRFGWGVLRGGSWLSIARLARSASRRSGVASGDSIGFRCARVQEQEGLAPSNGRSVSTARHYNRYQSVFPWMRPARTPGRDGEDR